jgi:ribosomal-protein-alanine N-acetyltransferase
MPAVAALEQACFTTAWRRESFQDSLTRPFTFFLALREDDELVGYALSWLLADELHLLKIAVRADCRRRGYGSRLLEETAQRAVAAGATMIWLEVRPSNDAGLALYERHGFKHAYTRRKYFTDTNEDALIFVRKLREPGAAS